MDMERSGRMERGEAGQRRPAERKWMKNRLGGRILAMTLGIALLLGGCGPIIPEPVPTPAPTAEATATPSPTPTESPTPAPTPTPEPIPAVLYMPNPEGKGIVKKEGTIREDSPLALIDALVEIGALPDVDYGKNIYFACETSQVLARTGKRKYKSMETAVVRLDISDAFAAALRPMKRDQERQIMQSFANTFLEYYGVEAFRLTVDGTDVEACGDYYDYALMRDTMVKTVKGGD